MCLSYLKKNRNWALFLAGMFFAAFMMSLIFYLLNIEITVFGITITKQLLIFRMIVTLAVAYLLLKHAEKAKGKGK